MDRQHTDAIPERTTLISDLAARLTLTAKIKGMSTGINAGSPALPYLSTAVTSRGTNDADQGFAYYLSLCTRRSNCWMRWTGTDARASRASPGPPNGLRCNLCRVAIERQQDPGTWFRRRQQGCTKCGRGRGWPFHLAAVVRDGLPERGSKGRSGLAITPAISRNACRPAAVCRSPT
jgi:hypothetical protein